MTVFVFLALIAAVAVGTCTVIYILDRCADTLNLWRTRRDLNRLYRTNPHLRPRTLAQQIHQQNGPRP